MVFLRQGTEIRLVYEGFRWNLKRPTFSLHQEKGPDSPVLIDENSRDQAKWPVGEASGKGLSRGSVELTIDCRYGGAVRCTAL